MADGDPETSEHWRAVLSGEDPGLLSLRRFWRRLPSSPRCKVCAAPFHGPGGVAARIVGFGPTRDNTLVCRPCLGGLAKAPGGAEVEITVLFADVRGSTALAERIPAAEFRELLQAYYHLAATAVDGHGGIVDKFLGDGVMALFIPVIAGENHAGRAVEAGRAILAAIEREGLAARGLLVGVGVHAGAAFVGSIGTAGRLDFTALGDTVNVAARLGDLAGPRELLVSRAAWDRARLGAAPAEREVEVEGRTGRLGVVSLTPVEPATGAASSARRLPDPVAVRVADQRDAPALAELGARTFRDAYAGLMDDADLDAYIGQAFTLERIREELADPDRIVLLAEPGGGAAPVGYAVVRHGAAHPLVAGPAPVELQRIYVDARAIGRGVGSVLLGAALANAANAGEATMWLAVWEQNARAIAFYERSRFATVGAQPFQIGSVVHRDLVMARPVGAG